MRTTRLRNFGVALFCVFLSGSIASAQPPAQNQATQFKKGYCVSSYNEGKIYFSDVFESNVPLNVRNDETPRDIANLFDAYLKQTHGYNSSPNNPVVCVFLNDVVSSEASKQQMKAQYTSANKQIVETVWKLSRQQAAALPSPAPQCYEHDATRDNSGCPHVASADAPSGASGQANPNGTSDVYAFCWASLGGYQYFSAAFSDARENSKDWVLGFAEFLKQKYDYKGFARCETARSLAEAQAQLQKFIDNARGTTSVKYVETGWVYTTPAIPPESRAAATSAPSSAPAVSISQTLPEPGAPSPPASATSTPKVTHAVCWADFEQHTRYYSAVFDGTGGDYNVWMPAFKNFLEQKYHYTGLVRCNKQPSKADAQKYWDDMVNFARGLTLGDGSNPKIIETGWTYK